MKHGGETFAAGLGIGVLALGLAPSALSSTGCAAQQDEVDAGTSSNPPPSPPLSEVAKQLFDELKPAFVAACGKGCHTTAVAFKNAPTFLAPPDEYKAIMASGFVTDDATASPLLNQREHEGPALATFPDLAAKVFTWLRFEALVKQKTALPSSGYAVINAGPNEIDMGPAGIPGVKIRFDAQMPGGILSLTKLRIFVPDLGLRKGATLSRPLFYRLRKDNKLFVDPGDTFSYVNAVFPGGVETPLPPGSAIFAVPDSWAPFQPGERVRIQADKFEIGDVSEVGTNPTCKNVALFQTNPSPEPHGAGRGGGDQLLARQQLSRRHADPALHCRRSHRDVHQLRAIHQQDQPGAEPGGAQAFGPQSAQWSRRRQGHRHRGLRQHLDAGITGGQIF
ncbi:MAG: hypothetical protein HOO96_12375 [Polyangiaceae bacterium]|nr:hypothetical protein [Polyangiaceae bacterium]